MTTKPTKKPSNNVTNSANALLDMLQRRSTPTPPTPKKNEEKTKTPERTAAAGKQSIFASAVATRNKTTTMNSTTAVYNSQSSAATANFGTNQSINSTAAVAAAKGIKPYEAIRRKRDERKKPTTADMDIDNNISMFSKKAGVKPSAYEPSTTTKAKKASSTIGLFSKKGK